MDDKNLAIRFGLGAIKAVGLKMIESAVVERNKDGKFKDIYDFCARMDAKNINKKSIEALAKSGAFDGLFKDPEAVNRRQIFESFDILSRFANEKRNDATNSQMNLFTMDLSEEEKKPQLKVVPNWSKEERLKKEFEAFGFFLNEHPIDDFIDDLKKRGVIFSNKIELQELEDNNIVKMSGVVASSKHRSGSKGRFAYLTMSDPFGIYEMMVFDEELINEARDLLTDGSMIVVECLIKKDEGGSRILAKDVFGLKDFIETNKARDSHFEDIKKQQKRSNTNNYKNFKNGDGQNYQKATNIDNSKEELEKKIEQLKNKKSYNYKNFKNGDGQNYQKATNIDNSKEELEKKIEQLKNKKSYSLVEIIIKNRDPIFNIKSFLSTKLIDQETAEKLPKTTKVILVVMKGQKIFKILLGTNYLLDESDCLKLRTIEKIVDVEAN
jgi:DNA polymerase III alpha subunit